MTSTTIAEEDLLLTRTALLTESTTDNTRFICLPLLHVRHSPHTHTNHTCMLFIPATWLSTGRQWGATDASCLHAAHAACPTELTLNSTGMLKVCGMCVCIPVIKDSPPLRWRSPTSQ